MKKKNYIKPNMRVVMFRHQPRLLAGSFESGGAPQLELDEE